MEILLTPRAQQIVDRKRLGCTNREVAAELGITEGTVRGYLRKLYWHAGIGGAAHGKIPPLLNALDRRDINTEVLKPRKKRLLAACGDGPLAVAEWLEELAVYGNGRRICDPEIAYQLSLGIENFYLVDLALNHNRNRKNEGRLCSELCSISAHSAIQRRG